MHYFIQEVAQQELGAMQGFLRRAQAIYDDNLSAYVKIVLRRPMGKILVCTSIGKQGKSKPHSIHYMYRNSSRVWSAF